MKTILRTIPIFLVLLMLTYFVPQIISDSPSEIVTQKKLTPKLRKEKSTASTPTIKQEVFSLTGIGQYMGRKSDAIKEIYGEPLRIETTSIGYERWIYGDNEKDYFQVGVSEEDTISSIFVLGTTLNLSPFKVGMDITEVYQLATLYPTFSIDYDGEKYTIELSENDLNYHPLVIFENDIYSILMIDRETNKINAIRYVDKQTLLKSDIYEVLPQNGISENEDLKIEIETINKEKTKEIEITLNALRKRYDLPELSYSVELSLMAENIFLSQNESSSKQLSEEELTQTESSEKVDSPNENKNFEEANLPVLTNQDIQDYLKMNKMSLADPRVVYSNQFTDATWLITYWFSLENQRSILTDPSMKRFGFAFRGEEVMFILDKEEDYEE
ncbi:MAG: CAP-associated domain-containing protein [Carnobacterium sp.]|uniref:CAP-associated domain-containing protein n=1 Tax=Carnobacterium sp. TaxID=48221 RepID=UPI003C742E97